MPITEVNDYPIQKIYDIIYSKVTLKVSNVFLTKTQ